MVVVVLMRRDSVNEAKVPRARVRACALAGWRAQRKRANPAKRISMPFGAGPRICPGRYLALLEMKMAMATLLGRFEIESVDTPRRRGPTSSCRSRWRRPLTMRLRARG